MIKLKNLNVYPFERNKFFYGKLLSVADFELEQKYMNDKRRFLSRSLLGYGIICGLNTYPVDDNSIMVESGAALDGTGREIVLHDSIIRKLSALDGFEALTANTLYLCIEYGESLADPVYSIAHTSGDATNSTAEYNRVAESYRLYVTDQAPLQRPASLLEQFITEQVVFSNELVTIVQRVPRKVSGQSAFQIQVEVLRKETAENLSFEYVLQTPYFDSSEGTNQVKVRYEDTASSSRKSQRLSYTLTPPSSMQTEASLVVDLSSFAFTENKLPTPLQGHLSFDISVEALTPQELVEREYFAVPLESPARSKGNVPLCLAKIELFRSNHAYLIESVQAAPLRQYIYNPQLLHLENQLAAFFPPTTALPSEGGQRAIDQAPAYATPSSINREPLSASGEFEIPLGFNPRPKEKFFSGEIMHGLGKGNVTLVAGISVSAANERISRGDATCYGNPEVFRDSDHDPLLPQCEISTLTYEDRGTFVVGVKLLEATHSLYLKIKWHAFKQPAPASEAPRQDSHLFIKPDTLVVAPRETAYFKAIFFNTDETPCQWRVVEEGGGVIEPTGIYTAPNKEGIYEIQVESLSNPELKATAFVVVKEKGAAE